MTTSNTCGAGVCPIAISAMTTMPAIGPNGAKPLLLLILPVSRLSFGEPFDGRREALLPRFVGLGFREPLDVVALLARRETAEGRLRTRVLLEGGKQIRRNLQRLPRRLRRTRLFHARVVERHRPLDPSRQQRLR